MVLLNDCYYNSMFTGSLSFDVMANRKTLALMLGTRSESEVRTYLSSGNYEPPTPHPTGAGNGAGNGDGEVVSLPENPSPATKVGEYHRLQ